MFDALAESIPDRLLVKVRTRQKNVYVPSAVKCRTRPVYNLALSSLSGPIFRYLLGNSGGRHNRPISAHSRGSVFRMRR